jgi:group I intron endonuclease
MKIACIYKIVNKINNKIYIGSTNNFSQRKRQHLHDLRYKKHGNDHLQKSFNKYGECNFYIDILELVDIEFLISREQFWIDSLNVINHMIGYNKNPIAGTTAGRDPSIARKTVETRRKNNPNWHPVDISQRIKDSLKNIDQSHNEATKQKISASMKKAVVNRDPESYLKMANTKKGKPIIKCRKKVKCVELNKVFDSIQLAADELKLQRTGISMVLNGTMQKTGGYTFERVT